MKKIKLSISPGPDGKRRLKRAGIVLLVVAAVLLVAAIALRIFFPRERIRRALTNELSRELNRGVTIENVSVGFYPDAEVVATGISIVDPQTSREMVSARKVRLDLNLLRLLKRKYELENIAVSSPRLDLVRAADGKWNVEELIENIKSRGKTPGAKADAEKKPGKLEIGPIQIRDGTIEIRDETSGTLLSVRKISVTVDLAGESVHIHSASVSYLPIEAKLSGTVSRFSEPYPVLDLNADIRVRKEGRLAEFRAADLPAGATIAEVSAKASGPTREIALNGTFALNRLATRGVETKGKLVCKLEREAGLLKVAAFDAHIGKSALSLSGVCSNIWTEERTASLEGTGTISLEEAFKLAGGELASKIEPQGETDASLALAASMERVGLKANIDLTNAGLVIPNLMRKQPGTPGSLRVDAHYVIPDEIVVDNFDLAIGEARLRGDGRMKPGEEPWVQASVGAIDFPLKSLDRLPSISFKEGTASLAAEVWQSNPSEKGVNYRGEARVEDALLVAEGVNEPVRDLIAGLKWSSQGATVESASFSFAESTFDAQAEITDFSRPHVVGTVHADMLDINAITGAVGKEKDDGDKSAPAGAEAPPGFSMEMLVEADSMQAGKLRTGPVSVTWRTSGESHSFDPFQIEAFGGEIRGSSELRPSEEGMRWAADFSGRGMRLESIVEQFQTEKTKAKGLLSAKGNLGGLAGPESKDALRSLQGGLRVTVTDGEIKQYPLLKSIFLLMQVPIGPALVPGVREISILNTLIDAAKTGGRSLDPSSIIFTTIDGSFQFTDGVAHTDDLRLESGTVNLICKGDIDLAENQMDMKIRAAPLGAVGSLVDKVPFAGETLTKAKETALSTDFIARGPIADPKVTLAAVERLKKAVNGKEEE